MSNDARAGSWHAWSWSYASERPLLVPFPCFCSDTVDLGGGEEKSQGGGKGMSGTLEAIYAGKKVFH